MPKVLEVVKNLFGCKRVAIGDSCAYFYQLFRNKHLHGPNRVWDRTWAIYRRKKRIAFASPMVDNTAANTRYFHHLNVDHNSWPSTLFVSMKCFGVTRVMIWAHVQG